MAIEGCSLCSSARGLRGSVLWEDAVWAVVHKRPPCGVVGHLMLLAKRHFQGPAHFTDTEAASVGLALRRCERMLQKVTGCDRVYTAALGSASAPHFHAHMMPVYTEGSAIGQPALPVSGTPFDIFLQEKLAKEGKLQADPAQCSQVSQAFAKAMAEDMSPPTAALDRCPPPSEDTQPTSTASSLKRPRADAEGRACRAVLFDLDDTLVMTSAIDRAAIHNAALRTVGQREAHDVANRFAELLKKEPFPPSDSSLDVKGWRIGLWERAIGVRAPSAAIPVRAIAQLQQDPGNPSRILAQEAYESWASERLNNFKFSPEVQAMVRRLQKAGYATGVLTNGDAQVQRDKLNACSASNLFDESKIIVAGEYAEQKPHASIFKTACEALGEPASATVMVGDNYNADIAGAMNAHLLSNVWVHSNDSCASLTKATGHEGVPLGKQQPAFIVSSVLELEEVLGQIN